MALRISGSMQRWQILLIIGGVGISAISIADNYKENIGWLAEIVRDSGIALVTASVLGFTIDRWIKSDLAKDVFEAAAGYFLPQEFKAEIKRIGEYKFICEKHYLKVQIENSENDCARVATTYERKFRNITSAKADLKGYVHTDEWGFIHELSKIIELELELDDGRRNSADLANVATNANGVPGLLATTETVSVAPNNTATAFAKWSEIRRRNDEISVQFGWPTLNPEIEVVAPDFECTVSFGPLDDEGKISQILRNYNRLTFSGTYFPGQRMRVRFWPKP